MFIKIADTLKSRSYLRFASILIPFILFKLKSCLTTCTLFYTKSNQRHTQQNAIDFIKYVVDKFPFRIHTIRTDRGHEFQALFHWYVEDQGMRHVYIKPRSPQLNGKVERSHRSDQDEFYQLLSYKDDVDLNKKLEAWEQFYNFNRPHGAFNGKTPYEALRSILI